MNDEMSAGPVDSAAIVSFAEQHAGVVVSSQSMTLGLGPAPLMGAVLLNNDALPGGAMGVILRVEEGCETRTLHARAFTNAARAEEAVRRRMVTITTQAT